MALKPISPAEAQRRQSFHEEQNKVRGKELAMSVLNTGLAKGRRSFFINEQRRTLQEEIVLSKSELDEILKEYEVLWGIEVTDKVDRLYPEGSGWLPQYLVRFSKK